LWGCSRLWGSWVGQERVSSGWPREEAERRWFCVDEREMGHVYGAAGDDGRRKL
jgi:hypothetical protein